MNNRAHTRRIGRREAAYLVFLAVMLVAAVALVIILSRDESPQSQPRDSALAWTAPPSEGLRKNPPGFENVVDDVSVVYAPYFELLKKAADSPVDALFDGARSDYTFGDLALRPHEFRGAPLLVKGRVLTLEPHYLQRGETELHGGSPGEISGTDIVYQTELVVMERDSVAEKYFLHTLAPPAHIAPGDEVVFAGYFYGRYTGKILELRTREEGVEKLGRVVAPLLVGGAFRPVSPRNAEGGRPVPGLSFTDVADGDEDISARAVSAAAKGLGELSPKQREELLGAAPTYFDLKNESKKYRGYLVKVRGEVLSVEKAGEEGSGIADFRRLILAVNRDGTFQHFYAVCLAPSAPEVEKGQSIELAGVFTETIKVKGARLAAIKIPLIIAADFSAISAPPRESATSTYFFILLVVLVILVAVAVILFLVSARRVSK
ncbi:MAG: hypothetical protein ABIH04_02485 [Planctomycetota bacterium]